MIAIELKTVQPNAGEMRGEKQKILEAKAALFNRFHNKEIEYYIGFPFDPTSDTSTGANKSKFLCSIIDGHKYFASDEILLASELWDFLSGSKNTMEHILDIINKIATKDFMGKFKYLNDNTNRKNNIKTYETLLNDWFLFSEIELLNNDFEITKNLHRKNRARRIYNQSIFRNGEYNFERYNFLMSLMDK
ncbi:MAG: TdeIII family type II restriction endonuclease [Candidatus Jettenia sp. CY-1]|nr:MAG: TdeIII family type II restriction endonuclease [Candidatus Jettenia sp. CY-1]